MDAIANFLFEIASLRRLVRSHSQLIQEADDNISDHSFRVAIIGMILANLEKCDPNKVLKMCLFHDVVESRTGDANYINKLYLKTYIMKEIVKLFFDKKAVKGEKSRILFNTLLSALNINKNRMRTRFFIILISQFLDSYNFNMDCNNRCSDDICVIKEGKAYKFPFCYYNIFKRDEFERI